VGILMALFQKALPDWGGINIKGTEGKGCPGGGFQTYPKPVKGDASWQFIGDRSTHRSAVLRVEEYGAVEEGKRHDEK